MDTKAISENKDSLGKLETDQNSQLELDREAVKKKATLLFLQGKRSIYIKDFQAALIALSESCQLFSQIYSEQDDSLADPYFYYGKALLEVGRNESDVLGDQVQDDDDDDDNDDENEDDNDDEDDNNGDDNDEEGDDSNDKKEQKEKESNEKAELEKNGNPSGSENRTDSQSTKKGKEEPQADAKNSTNNLDDENGEINDLQLSWEYLELAKLIYLKKADSCKDIAIKLAETYLCLGENGLESENYSVAIEDIKQALELQKKHLNEEDRRIAETYYQLGVAHSLDQNYDEAIESFKKAIEHLEMKISSLETRKKIGDKKTEEEEKDAFYTMDGEINEIRVVIKDVEEKIKDMKESKNKVKAELIKQVCRDGQTSSASEDGQAGSLTTSVTDISHLIKRKRKNEENSTNEEKKLKTEN